MHSEIDTFTFANPGLRANCLPASIGRDGTSGKLTTTARHTIQLTTAIPLGFDERCPGKKIRLLASGSRARIREMSNSAPRAATWHLTTSL